MLIYVDTPDHVRVVRIDKDQENAPARTPIGRIAKAGYIFSAQPGSPPISGEEEHEISQVVQKFKNCIQAKLQVDVMTFPDVARRIAEFYSTATDLDRRLISTAVITMVRAIRKVDKGEFLT